MSEPRPATSGSGTIESIVQLARHINLGGLPAVAWTFVLCIALWKQNGDTLKWLWPELLRIWVYLIVVWAAFTAVYEIVAFVRKRLELVPVVAHPAPRVAPAVAEHAANE